MWRERTSGETGEGEGEGEERRERERDEREREGRDKREKVNGSLLGLIKKYTTVSIIESESKAI